MIQVFVTHASNFDYQNNLYKPLLKSFSDSNIQLILPHLEHIEPTDTRAVILHSNFVLAEVSYPSTGSGIELGWANQAGIPVIAIHHSDAAASSCIKLIAKKTYHYHDIDSILTSLSHEFCCT